MSIKSKNDKPEWLYTSQLNGFKATELPLKPVKSRKSTQSTWSTEANADEDVDYQNDHSSYTAGSTSASAKAPVADKRVMEETSGAGGWADSAQKL